MFVVYWVMQGLFMSWVVYGEFIEIYEQGHPVRRDQQQDRHLIEMVIQLHPLHPIIHDMINIHVMPAITMMRVPLVVMIKVLYTLKTLPNLLVDGDLV